MKLNVRDAKPQDGEELAALLNEIIEIGGTTAHQKLLDAPAFSSIYIESDSLICCFVAQGDDGTLLGFQALEHKQRIPEDWGDIATFAKVGAVARGIGTALFEATLARAQENGLVALSATIRADNSGGLKYYGKMGFETYKVDAAKPLVDGTPIDRISKKYVLPSTPQRIDGQDVRP